MRQPLRQPHPLRAEEIENWHICAEYIIYQDGADTVSMNGQTGVETFRSTSVGDVINNTILALTLGGRIFITAGRYELDKEINIADSTIYLMGAGKGFGLNDYCTLLNVAGGVRAVDISGGVFHRISGIYFRGGTLGITATSTPDIMIDDCSFTDQALDGINLATVKHSIIKNNWIEYVDRTGIDIKDTGYEDLGHFKIYGNHITHWGTYGLVMEGPETPRGSYVGFNNFYTGDAGSNEAIRCLGVSHLNIAWNLIGGLQANQAGINLVNDGGGHGICDAINIVGNVFRNKEGVAENMKYCIQSDHATGHVVVAYNNFSDFITAAMNVTAGSDIHYSANHGFITESGGVTGVVADGGTFAHGLDATPTYVVVTGSVAGDLISVSALGAANVTVNIKDEGGGAGTAQILYWRAYYTD